MHAMRQFLDIGTGLPTMNSVHEVAQRIAAGAGLTLALVRNSRELREPSGANEIEAFETDVLAGFVLARPSAGLADSTIRNDTGHLDLIRGWFGRPLWEMQCCVRGVVGSGGGCLRRRVCAGLGG
jgi:S-adenosyl methyltransferase